MTKSDPPSRAASHKQAVTHRESKIFYFEAQILGGDPPVPGLTGFCVPPELRDEVGAARLPLLNAGTMGCSIGIIEAHSTLGLDLTTSPFNSMVWARVGLRVPLQPDGNPSLLGALGLHPTPPRTDLALQSGDRIGVLVDYREGKIGFEPTP